MPATEGRRKDRYMVHLTVSGSCHIFGCDASLFTDGNDETLLVTAGYWWSVCPT